MNFIINPGTESREDSTEANALICAKELATIFKSSYPDLKLKRNKAADDNNGWYGFKFTDGDKSIDVDIPGDDPEQVMKGEPWVSRRLYVDGSSWLWGFAVGIIEDRLKEPQNA